MALKITLKTERIDFADGDFIEVRGLGVPDIMQLVEVHSETVSDLFDQFTGRDPNSITIDDLDQVPMALATRCPAIVAHVIALAADAQDQMDVVAKLPIDVQVAALEKIGTLTFGMQGGVKNFVETVTRIARGADGLIKEVKKPLLT